MEAGCELRLMQQRIISLKALIQHHDNEVHKHKKIAFQQRQELKESLKEEERLKEKCKCKES